MTINQPFQIIIPKRSFVKISGPDSFTFLQGLITNDLRLLDNQGLIYACFLSPQGKFQYDFFILRPDPQTYILDCADINAAQALHNMLLVYKLRSDIDLSIISPDQAHIIAGSHLSDMPKKAALTFPDPRLSDLGWRQYIFTPQDDDNHKPDNAALYNQHRLSLSVPDGAQDLIYNKSTLLEFRLDRLHAISFDKGCYLGQELTARMHYRGLAKKHLYGAILQKTTDQQHPQPGQDIRGQLNGNNILWGEMRSSSDRYAIAVLKDEYNPQNSINAANNDANIDHVILHNWMIDK